MKFIKSIDIDLENCDYIHIEPEYIGHFDLANIQRDIWRCGCNALGDSLTAGDVAIEIFKEVGDYHCFLDGKTESVIKRLTDYKDITSITIYYGGDNNEQETIYTVYDDEEIFGADNKYEKTYISELGNLYIVISKDKDIEDFFNKEEINDKENIFGYGWFS